MNFSDMNINGLHLKVNGVFGVIIEKERHMFYLFRKTNYVGQFHFMDTVTSICQLMDKDYERHCIKSNMIPKNKKQFTYGDAITKFYLNFKDRFYDEEEKQNNYIKRIGEDEFLKKQKETQKQNKEKRRLEHEAVIKLKQYEKDKIKKRNHDRRIEREKLLKLMLIEIDNLKFKNPDLKELYSIKDKYYNFNI